MAAFDVCHAGRYYHRTLNPKKLVETGFSHLGKSQSMALTVKLFKLPEKPLTAGFRLAEAGDMPHVHRLMTEFIGTRAFGPVMSLQEVKHWMQPRKNVVYTYVVQAAKGAEITDFVSFYCLPSSVISHPVHKVIKAAYLFYYAHTATPLNELIKDALIAARNVRATGRWLLLFFFGSHSVTRLFMVWLTIPCSRMSLTSSIASTLWRTRSSSSPCSLGKATGSSTTTSTIIGRRP